MHFAKPWPPLRACLRQAFASFSALVSRGRSPTLPRVFVVVEGQNDIDFSAARARCCMPRTPDCPILSKWSSGGNSSLCPAGEVTPARGLGVWQDWHRRNFICWIGTCRLPRRCGDRWPQSSTRGRDAARSSPKCDRWKTICIRPPSSRSAVYGWSSPATTTWPIWSLAKPMIGMKDIHPGSRFQPGRKRQRDKAKAWLNILAVQRMTAERLSFPPFMETLLMISASESSPRDQWRQRLGGRRRFMLSPGPWRPWVAWPTAR